MVGPEGGESVADVAIRVSEALVQMEADVQGFVFSLFSYHAWTLITTLKLSFC